MAANFWLNVLNDPRTRGIGDFLIAFLDGLVDLAEAIGRGLPQTAVPTGIAHPIRESLDYTSGNDRDAVDTATRPVCFKVLSIPPVP